MKLFDSDVHILWDSVEELVPYVPETWHRRLRVGSGHSQGRLPLTQPFFDPRKGTAPEGFRCPEALQHWMDESGTAHAVLQNERASAVSTFGDADYPAWLAEAYNRWLVDQWLERDERWLGTITVATQDPMRAAREIRRAGAHPRVVQVALSAGTLQPYGKPVFWPIYEAAEEAGLAVAIHAGSEGVGISNPPSSHGYPGNLLEYRVCPVTNFISHLTSLVTEGVFTRFPALRLVGLEVGGALPLITYLWRFDKNFKALRSECPWVTELPSEIIRRHVRLGVQSAVVGDDALYFSLLESFGADQLLLWTSNAPRWNALTAVNDPHLQPRTRWQSEAVGWTNAATLYPSNAATLSPAGDQRS